MAVDTDFIKTLMKFVKDAFTAIQGGQDYVAQTLDTPGLVQVVVRSPRALRSMGSQDFYTVYAYWGAWSVTTPLKSDNSLAGTVIVSCSDYNALEMFRRSAIDALYELAPSPIPGSVVVLPFQVGGLT